MSGDATPSGDQADHVVGAREVAAPIVVEIEVNTRCNRRCGYCPVATLPPSAGSKTMPRRLFDKIIADLEAIAFAGRLSYHLYNEPLLRKDLEHLVRHATQRLPGARQILYTNGDLLTDPRYDSLIEAGIDSIVVTRHDSDVYPDRPRQVVLTPRDLDITNRGGLIYEIGAPLGVACHAPAEMLVITASGDVLICYEDAKRENIIGNVLDQTILSVWTSERFAAIRRDLARGQRSAALCAKCSNRAHVTRGASWFAL